MFDKDKIEELMGDEVLVRFWLCHVVPTISGQVALGQNSKEKM